MKKTEWPIRWDLLLRYRLIEIIALWEGRLTTNHICHGFGIGRQQASKDINTYLRELAPDNLVYDRHIKGYVPAEEFRPVVTKGTPEEYLELAGRHKALSECFESLDIQLPGTTLLQVPSHRPDPGVVRSAVTACRHRRRLTGHYVSLENPAGSAVTIEPHTLAMTARGWHLRAWCNNTTGFRDFSLCRFRDPVTVSSERARHRSHEDEYWQRQVTVVLKPDHRLTDAQQEIIASDYAMRNQRLELHSRVALLPYLLPAMGVSVAGIAAAQPMPLELANKDTLAPWLPEFSSAGSLVAEPC